MPSYDELAASVVRLSGGLAETRAASELANARIAELEARLGQNPPLQVPEDDLLVCIVKGV